MARCRATLFIILVYCVYNVFSNKRGHLQPFGRHTVPQEVEALEEFPIPVDFYEKYQRPGKPVLFKSVLNKSEFPPFRRWTDDYLRRHFGHLMVEVEDGKKETRAGTLNAKTLKEFLDSYQEEDIYLVQDITKSMFKDMHIPRSIQCGGFQNFIDTIVIWFSAGGTKSVVHLDTQDNINCLLDGTKDIVFVDRKYEHLMEADGFRDDGGFSELDVDKVDMEKFPRIQEIPTYNVTMEAGDCLYIPYKWYHQVNSFGKRNIAINFWNTRVNWFNYSDCEGVDFTHQTVPFSKYGFIGAALKANSYLFDALLDLPHVTKEDVFKRLLKPKAVDKDVVWKYLNRDGDSVLTWQELFKVNATDLIENFGKSLKISPTFFEDIHDLEYHHEDRTVEEFKKQTLKVLKATDEL